jgi:hypothetical protein
MFTYIRTRLSVFLALGATVVGIGIPSTAYAQTDAPQGRFRAAGEITAVQPASASFELETLRGETLAIVTDETTQFHSADGAIQSVSDLAVGMKAFALGIITPDGQHLARQVGAGSAQGIRRHVVRKVGEITSVVPGQLTISLQPAQGDEIQLNVTDRTHFVSRDQSVTDIHDLKKGMKARIAALVKDDGSLEAIVVAVASPDGGGQVGGVDVRFGGRIAELGDNTMVVQSPDGQQRSVAVDDQTVYRSVQGKVKGFDDLKTGMLVAVGAKNDGSQLTAVWVAASRARPFLGGQGAPAGPAAGSGSQPLPLPDTLPG